MRAGFGRADLRARAARHVCAGRRQRLRPQLQRPRRRRRVTYGDVFLQAEQEYSRHNFEFADTAILFQHFKDAEAACTRAARARRGGRARI